MKSSLKILVLVSCLAGATGVQSAERTVLCEEFTNRY
jgi:hypothetical protein